MLFDPMQLAAHWQLTLATLAIVLIGKPVAAFAVVRLLRHPVKTAVAVAVALGQIGEFSFVLAALARQLELLPAAATPALVAASIVSISLNPLLFRRVEPIARWLSRSRASHALEAAEHAAPVSQPPERNRAIVVGYGPVGRTVVRLLRAHAMEPMVIELNHETVHALHEQKILAIYGDSTQREILEQAGVRSAVSLIFSASVSPVETIKAARELNPQLFVLARSTYVGDGAALLAAGAQSVVSSEAEVALAIAERVLRELGATAEQLDRVRDEVRSELGEAKPA
jgi:monovalent cation:H+ antiporter-2, CPA2 family